VLAAPRAHFANFRETEEAKALEMRRMRLIVEGRVRRTKIDSERKVALAGSRDFPLSTFALSSFELQMFPKK